MASTLTGLRLSEPVKPGGPQPSQVEATASPAAPAPPTPPVPEATGLAALSFDKRDDAQLTLEKEPDDGEFSDMIDRLPEGDGHNEDDAFFEKFQTTKFANSMAGINIGIAELLDLPFEVSAMILRQIPGLQNVRGNVFESLFKAGGIFPTRDGKEAFDRDSTEFQIGKVVGNSIAALPIAPLSAGVQTTVQTGKAVGLGATIKAGAKETAQTIGKTAVTSPAGFAAAEVVSGLGAGAGLQFARENFPDSPTTQFLAGMAGGAAGALPVTRLVVKSAGTIRNKFTTAQTRGVARAAEELDKAAIDIGEAAKRLDNPELLDGLPTTAAQKTQDKGLMALERTIKNQSHKSQFESDEQIQRMADGIDDSLRAGDEAIEATRATLQEQKDYTVSLIDTNLKMAARKADDAIAELGPSATAQQMDRIARREIESVETLARADEKKLWDVVPRDTELKANASTQVMRELFLKEFKSRTFKGRKNLPSELELEKFLGTFKIGKKKNKFFTGGQLTKKATMGEMQDLRSDVLREIRKQRSELSPNNQTIRILDDLQEALLLDMGALTGGKGTPEGDSLRLALTYSRTLNEKFNRGIMAKLKGVDKLGTAAIPEELTLVTAFGGKPEKAAENLRTIITATKGVEGDLVPPPEMMGAMEDYIKTQFMKGAARGGKINPDRGRLFLERNLKILDEFPEIRKDVITAIETGKRESVLMRRSDVATATPPVGKMSKAALFIEKSPKKMFEALEAERPAKFELEINKLLKKVNRDDSGEALEGLQASFFDWMRVRSKGRGVDMERLINTPKIAAIMGKVLTPGQIDRMRKITNSMKLVESAKTTKGIDSEILEGGESKMLTTLMRIAGAKAGGKFSAATGGGAGGLQTASITSERFKAFAPKVKAFFSTFSSEVQAAKLIIDAFEDESGELLKTLLTEVKSAKQLKEVSLKLNAWAASVAYQTGGSSLAENTEEK